MRFQTNPRMPMAALAGLIAVSGFAQNLDPVVPDPNGLVRCSQDDPVLKSLQRTVPALGSLAGCFRSRETATIPTATKTISLPVETAFAMVLHGPNNRAYTKDDLDGAYSKAQDQWRNVKPLWNADRSRYEQSVEDLVESASGNRSHVRDLSIDQPTLISMEQLNGESYVVVSVRHYGAKTEAGNVSITKVEGTAVVLNRGTLLRLTLLRELREKGDVESVRKAIASWADAIGV